MGRRREGTTSLVDQSEKYLPPSSLHCAVTPQARERRQYFLGGGGWRRPLDRLIRAQTLTSSSLTQPTAAGTEPSSRPTTGNTVRGFLKGQRAGRSAAAITAQDKGPVPSNSSTPCTGLQGVMEDSEVCLVFFFCQSSEFTLPPPLIFTDTDS